MEPDQWQLGRTKVFVKNPESVSICDDMCSNNSTLYKCILIVIPPPTYGE